MLNITKDAKLINDIVIKFVRTYYENFPEIRI